MREILTLVENIDSTFKDLEQVSHGKMCHFLIIIFSVTVLHSMIQVVYDLVTSHFFLSSVCAPKTLPVYLMANEVKDVYKIQLGNDQTIT